MTRVLIHFNFYSTMYLCGYTCFVCNLGLILMMSKVYIFIDFNIRFNFLRFSQFLFSIIGYVSKTGYV